MFLFSPTEEKKALDKFEEDCVQTMLFKLSSRSQTDSRFLSSGYAEAASSSRQCLPLGFQHHPLYVVYHRRVAPAKDKHSG